jgi:hypothetical protein
MRATDPDIDVLWQKASSINQCTVSRSCQILEAKSKIHHGNYQICGVTKNGNLIGLFTSRYKKESRQWLIGDLCSLDKEDSLCTTILEACHYVETEYLQLNPDDDNNYKAAILATPSMEKMLSELGFVKDNYQFLFAVHLLDRTLTKKDVAPENWYVCDSD